ncbi:hypothetical protein [Streptomyces sp. NBC_01320]|uniref:hypothetical protein n=1 Tax=Streptomyces sp. NBC_01320 TaxID=2903824 RepID=UPI002E0EF63F|nr:hypothetical protein OG395_48665 [Streptomyces sp. NBC_01320]
MADLDEVGGDKAPELERYRSSRPIALRSFEIAVVFDEAGEGVLVSHGDQGLLGGAAARRVCAIYRRPAWSSSPGQ